VSEILALRWSRINFAQQSVLVKVKAVNGRVSRAKTECSEALSPTGATTRVRSSRITSSLLRRSAWLALGGTPSAVPAGLLLDAVGAPIGVQQKMNRHALTGSFTLDVYGGKPEWDRNLEAARLAGAEIEKAVQQESEKPRLLAA